MDKLRQGYWSWCSGCLYSYTLQTRGPKGAALLSLPLPPASSLPLTRARKGYPCLGISHGLRGDHLELTEQNVWPDQLGRKWMIFPLNTVIHPCPWMPEEGQASPQPLWQSQELVLGDCPSLPVAMRSHLVVRHQAVSENKYRRMASRCRPAWLGFCKLAQGGANLQTDFHI